MPQADVIHTVRGIVAEVLGHDIDAVRSDSVLMAELGAESIDLLDIVFKLEQAFDIQITRGALEKAARGDMSDEEFAPNGFVSEPGLERLRMLMPEVADKVVSGLRPAQIVSLFTTQTFVNITHAKLAERNPS